MTMDRRSGADRRGGEAQREWLKTVITQKLKMGYTVEEIVLQFLMAKREYVREIALELTGQKEPAKPCPTCGRTP